MTRPTGHFLPEHRRAHVIICEKGCLLLNQNNCDDGSLRSGISRKPLKLSRLVRWCTTQLESLMSTNSVIVYLGGAICTAWVLNASSANQEKRFFLSAPALFWPVTAIVFGLLILASLLAHWCDKLTAVFTTGKVEIDDHHSRAGAPPRLPGPSV